MKFKSLGLRLFSVFCFLVLFLFSCENQVNTLEEVPRHGMTAEEAYTSRFAAMSRETWDCEAALADVCKCILEQQKKVDLLRIRHSVAENALQALRREPDADDGKLKDYEDDERMSKRELDEAEAVLKRLEDRRNAIVASIRRLEEQMNRLL